MNVWIWFSFNMFKTINTFNIAYIIFFFKWHGKLAVIILLFWPAVTAAPTVTSPAVADDPWPGSDCRLSPPRTPVESTPARPPARWCTGSGGRSNEEQFREAFPIGILKQEVAAPMKRRGHLVVSGHQLLDGLSVDGGYVLDVGAFLLG